MLFACRLTVLAAGSSVRSSRTPPPPSLLAASGLATSDIGSTQTLDASWVWDAHAAEMANGLSKFALPAAEGLIGVAGGFEYITHDVGMGNAGPDEHLMHGGHLVHATAAPILTDEERVALMVEAGSAMKAGATSRFTYTAASRIDEVHTAELPAARQGRVQGV